MGIEACQSNLTDHLLCKLFMLNLFQIQAIVWLFDRFCLLLRIEMPAIVC